MKEFTILMPCYNEEASLAFCIKEAQSCIGRLALDAEILIADNGSTDRSVQIATSHGARVVSIAEKGYGAALIGGINAAEGKYIIMGDSDGSYDFGHLDEFVSELRAGYSLVMGNRFRGGIEKGAMPASHHIGAPALSLLAKWRFHTPNVSDYHCGLRGFNTAEALALGLQCPGMEFATELIARFSATDAKISEVPTILRKDLREHEGNLRTVRDGFRHLKFIFSFQPKK